MRNPIRVVRSFVRDRANGLRERADQIRDRVQPFSETAPSGYEVDRAQEVSGDQEGSEQEGGDQKEGGDRDEGDGLRGDSGRTNLRRRVTYLLTTPEERGGEFKESQPDVFLDVSKLSVDNIELEVDDLFAQVALQAKVAELVDINVGATVEISKVDLEIEGVEAEALLKVRLDEVRQIVSEAMHTLRERPELLTSALENTEKLTQGALEEAGEASERVLDEAGEAAGDITDEITEDLDGVTEDLDGAGKGPSIEARSRTQS